MYSTYLLPLTAAIEVENAGESGCGFAMVDAGDPVTGGPDDSRAARLDCDHCLMARLAPRHAQGSVSASATGFAKTGMATLYFHTGGRLKRRVTMCGAACGLG